MIVAIEIRSRCDAIEAPATDLSCERIKFTVTAIDATMFDEQAKQEGKKTNEFGCEGRRHNNELQKTSHWLNDVPKVQGDHLLFKLALLQYPPAPSVREPANDGFQGRIAQNHVQFDREGRFFRWQSLIDG